MNILVDFWLKIVYNMQYRLKRSKGFFEIKENNG